jgi:hypothetical protein
MQVMVFGKATDTVGWSRLVSPEALPENAA